MQMKPDVAAEFGCLASIPRTRLFAGPTPLESMPNLASYCGGPRLLVKRDDCNGLAFGGNKVRQLEFYLGAACSENADTILITGAVQSNFVRLAAAGARKLGMDCHIQLEDRVASPDDDYRRSGNVFLDKLFGATLHSYPEGEDEAGADRQVQQIAAELRAAGKAPYIIPLAAGHPPLGALGYVLAAAELLTQIHNDEIDVDEIFVGSGSGATHAGLLFGLRALGSQIAVTGVCVRRDASLQKPRIRHTCDQIATLLETEAIVTDDDIRLIDSFLAPGYGVPNQATLHAIVTAAQTEALLLDPVYTGRAMAGLMHRAKQMGESNATLLFLHTGGVPAIFAYQDVIENALASPDGFRLSET